MDDFMTGRDFPEPLVWIAGVALIVFVGWLIERRAKRRVTERKSETQAVRNGTISDADIQLYAQLHGEWMAQTDGKGSLVPSEYSAHSLALRVWQNELVFNDLTQVDGRWVAFLGFAAAGDAHERRHKVVSDDSAAPLSDVVFDFMCALAEDHDDAQKLLELLRKQGRS